MLQFPDNVRMMCHINSYIYIFVFIVIMLFGSCSEDIRIVSMFPNKTYLKNIHIAYLVFESTQLNRLICGP